MKRLFCLIFVLLLLLAGCGGEKDQTTPVQTTEPSEPAVSWIETLGKPWDAEGVLREIPLNIPDGQRYSSVMGFDGDLLLWSVDDHLAEVSILELCLVELDDGSVVAEKEISLSGYCIPQVLGDKLFLCDSASGKILELNKSLEIVNSWQTGAKDADFYMGANETLYIRDWENGVIKVNLNSDLEESAAEDISCDSFTPMNDSIYLRFYEPHTGRTKSGVLDLSTGETHICTVRGNFDSVWYEEGTWLCDRYQEGSVVTVGSEADGYLRISLGDNCLQLLDRDTMLYSNLEDGVISLHDIRGNLISRAVVSERPYGFSSVSLILSETFGGYFVVINNYSESFRLLYWDTSKGTAGEDLPLEPIPEPDEQELLLRTRADALGVEYGLNILLGTDCDTYYNEYTAEICTDWDQVDYALDVLEEVLAQYPEGFFRQLRYEQVVRTDIYLNGILTANNPESRPFPTAAVVYENYDSHVMVVDIYSISPMLIYHEFSHIIDTFLEWDAMNREDALFSEETWNSLNPDWFPGYTYDYAQEVELEDFTYFQTSYATINPTEDRARVMEYAMWDLGGWAFEDAEGLVAKLDYYSRCIRDAFDTTGWPETVLWEQYLP